jgi:hypothetical protein
MSLDLPNSNKMMTSAPEKKEFHFASDSIHYAEVVWADTIDEATKLYHQVKRKITVAGFNTTAGPASAIPPSTTASAAPVPDTSTTGEDITKPSE